MERTTEQVRSRPGEPALHRWDAWLHHHPGWVSAGLWLGAFILYARALSNSFVSDDDGQIIQNPLVRNAHLWRRIFTAGVWSFQGRSFTNFYRPLHIFSHWLVFRIAGANPAAFHLYQLIFFAATACLVYRIGRLVLQSDCAALAGTWLWMAHPQKVEAVSWIAATPEVGMGFFYALAFWLFLEAERRPERPLRYYGASALAFFPALFFKEMALSFPLLILAYWFFFPPRSSKRHTTARWVVYLVPVAVYLGTRYGVLGHLTQHGHLWDISAELLAGAVGLLGQHARLFVWPARLSLYRAFDLRPALLSPWPWIALGVLGAALWGRKRYAAAGFLVFWWAVTLLPCLDVRQLSVPFVADRFSYLPSAGLCLAVAGWVIEALAAPTPRLGWRAVAMPGLVVLLFAWIFVTVRTIPNWRDNEVAMQCGLARAPQDPLVHIASAIELRYRYGDLAGSRREYEEALRLNGASWRPNPGVTADCDLGLGAIAQQEQHLGEALAYYHEAARLASNSNRAYDALGAVYFPRRDYAKAAEYFAAAVQADPDDLGSRFYLGTCWMQLGKYRAAAEQFRAAVAVDPSYREAWQAEARAWTAAGDAGAALQARRRAAESN